MDKTPQNHFIEHVEYQSEILESIDRKLTAVQIAAIIFITIVAFQCLLVVLYLAGLISLTRLLMR